MSNTLLAHSFVLLPVGLTRAAAVGNGKRQGRCRPDDAAFKDVRVTGGMRIKYCETIHTGASFPALDMPGFASDPPE